MTPTQHHILVADDDETFLLSTADLLRREGFQCACAEDAAAAASQLKEEHFDLLISDVRMAGNTQLELIRQMPQLARQVPVVLVTAYPSARTAAEALRLPVIEYLFKPFELDELLAAVACGIRQAKLNRLLASMQARQEDICQQMVWLMDSTATQSAGRSAPDMTIGAFVNLSLQHIVGSLSDVFNLVSGMLTGQPKRQACKMLACPRADTLMAAIKQAVGVLEKTKSSFKSKDLGDLRKCLIDVIDGQ